MRGATCRGRLGQLAFDCLHLVDGNYQQDMTARCLSPNISARPIGRVHAIAGQVHTHHFHTFPCQPRTANTLS
jgi:hypothetical protein